LVLFHWLGFHRPSNCEARSPIGSWNRSRLDPTFLLDRVIVRN
jgi:hypothetical protein